MGIPRFFRWIAQRYPLIIQEVNKGEILPIFDNFYIDMNGLIHQSAHDIGTSVVTPDTLGKILVQTFCKVDQLFAIAMPKKVLYLSVDGVAPRAKINHQRKRRFVHARDLENSLGDSNVQNVFDSNCISPGTEFMSRLNVHIKDCIQKKVSYDAAWRKVKVIYSGSDVPGEGEHKIMQYIREQKATPNYDPNTSHCIYSSDADLILLSLVTHEPHFTIIRDSVFTVFKDVTDPKFIVAHISMLREYIYLEFEVLSPPGVLDFPFDLENIIDDLVLLTFFVGNDFLPALPGLEIDNGALDRLFAAYKQILKAMGGYITSNGFINFGRFNSFMNRYSSVEYDYSREYAHRSFLNAGSKIDSFRGLLEGMVTAEEVPFKDVVISEIDLDPRNEAAVTEIDDGVDYGDDIEVIGEGGESEERDENEDGDGVVYLDPSLTAEGGCEKGMEGFEMTFSMDAEMSDDISSEEKEMERGFLADEKLLDIDLKSGEGRKLLYERIVEGEEEEDEEESEEEKMEVPCWSEGWRRVYYDKKLGILLEGDDRSLDLDILVGHYVKGLAWNYHYYYHGCVSWSWYYPYHYSPLIRDLVGLGEHEVRFEYSRPYCPIEQLLAIIPPFSSGLLPRAYMHFLTDPRSPLHKYCPREFEIDMNNMREEWRGVVLLPFIDEGLIERVYDSVPESMLSETEKYCNRVGKDYVYVYNSGSKSSVEVMRYRKPRVRREFLVRIDDEDLEETLEGKLDKNGLFMASACEGLVFINSFKLRSNLGSESKPGSLPCLFSKELQPSLQKNNTFVFRHSVLESLVLQVQQIGTRGFSRDLSESRVVKFKNAHSEEQERQVVQRAKKEFAFESSCFKWPYFKEMLVVGISTRRGISTGAKWSEWVEWDHRGASEWIDTASRCYTHYRNLAVSLDTIYCMLRVKEVVGMARSLDGGVSKRWAPETYVPVQLALSQCKNRDVRFLEKPGIFRISSSLVNCVAISLQPSDFYGQLVRVERITRRLVVVRGELKRPQVFSYGFIMNSVSEWIVDRLLGEMFGISRAIMNQLCSFLSFNPGKVNLGLDFRSPNSYAIDYVFFKEMARRDGTSYKRYFYSKEAVAIVHEYFEIFPQLQEYLRATDPAKTYEIEGLFGGYEKEEYQAKLDKIQQWISKLPVASGYRMECSAIAFSTHCVNQICKMMADSRAKQADQNSRPFVASLKPSQFILPLSFMEMSNTRGVDALGLEVKLGNPVVYVMDSGPVEFGKTGIVIALKENGLHVLLDEPSLICNDLGGHCPMHRGISVPYGSIINRTIFSGKRYKESGKGPGVGTRDLQMVTKLKNVSLDPQAPSSFRGMKKPFSSPVDRGMQNVQILSPPSNLRHTRIDASGPPAENPQRTMAHSKPKSGPNRYQVKSQFVMKNPDTGPQDGTNISTKLEPVAIFPPSSPMLGQQQSPSSKGFGIIHNNGPPLSPSSPGIHSATISTPYYNQGTFPFPNIVQPQPQFPVQYYQYHDIAQHPSVVSPVPIPMPYPPPILETQNYGIRSDNDQTPQQPTMPSDKEFYSMFLRKNTM